MTIPYTQHRLNPSSAGVIAAAALMPLSVLASVLMIRNGGRLCIAQDCPEKHREDTVWTSVFVYYAFLLLVAIITFIYQRAPIFYAHPSKTMRLSLPWSTRPGLLLSEVGMWIAVIALQIGQTWLWFSVYGFNRDEGDVFGEDRGEPTVLGLDWVDWKILYKVLGYPAAIQIALTLLPTSRAGILSSVFRIPFDVALSFHRASGWLAVAFSALHGIAFCIFALLRGGVKLLMLYFFFWGADERRWRSYTGWVEAVGLISFLLFTWVAFNSLESIRRKTFNWFYFNHFAVLGAILTAFMHASPVIHFGLPALSLYVADGFVRIFNRAFAFEAGRLVVEACGYVRLDVLDCDMETRPGQWVSINIPMVSEMEWHPFTVVSSAMPKTPPQPTTATLSEISETTPLLSSSSSSALVSTTQPHQTGMTLIIKPVASEKSWTRSLVRAFEDQKTLDPESSNPHIKVHIEGPYGTLPPQFLNSPYFLIIVGGSGVPGGIRLACAALEKPSTKGIKFVWTTREEEAESLSCYREMVELGKRRGGGILDASVVVTAQGEGRGRIDVRGLVCEYVQGVRRRDRGATTSLYACGPGSLESAVRGATADRRCRESGGRLVVQIEGYSR
ncbi:hypothetical protein HK097_001722 [Rhizophlyctis rosea]|uniref:FAD-binding FR-type domain-containing protein n=1 Tax=Rhizophlyctis rosea TaxID=64517 RepID=A0AAD5X3F2_9FUNG|nr:hypothetical protein HK097_001722 [Rhizophlyctis rosea]